MRKPSGTEPGMNSWPEASTSSSRVKRDGASVTARHATSPPSELPPMTALPTFNASSTSSTKRAYVSPR